MDSLWLALALKGSTPAATEDAAALAAFECLAATLARGLEGDRRVILQQQGHNGICLVRAAPEHTTGPHLPFPCPFPWPKLKCSVGGGG